MPATLSPGDVLALAPDAVSVKRARALATPRPWTMMGAAGSLVWGECRGSAEEPYRTAADLDAQVFACTCPSSKFPCKHALGLLLLWAGGQVPEALPGEVPEWARPHEAEQGELRARRAPDREAQARRAAGRAARMTAGLSDLEQWLQDVARTGLAALQSDGPGPLEMVAARLVDAQAPGAATFVRRLSWMLRSGEGWEVRALSQLARLWLLASAWPRLAELPAELAAEVRTVAGWSRTAEDVSAGPTVRDRWSVVGRWESPEWETDRIRIQRTWLWGEERGAPALLLDFAPPNGRFFPDVEVGTVIDADVVFYPGSWPHRAVVLTRHSDPAPLGVMPGWPTLDAALAAHAEALAANPWLERWPMVLSGVVATGHGLRDVDGNAIGLRFDGDGDEVLWRLLAMSGGRPVGVAGEWEDGLLLPLAATASGRFVAL
jgi:hypothetical protein